MLPQRKLLSSLPPQARVSLNSFLYLGEHPWPDRSHCSYGVRTCQASFSTAARAIPYVCGENGIA